MCLEDTKNKGFCQSIWMEKEIRQRAKAFDHLNEQEPIAGCQGLKVLKNA